jgi:hypothetical protein
MLSFSEYINERSDHNNRIRVISGWSVVMTLHGVDRDKERMNSLDDDKWNMFFERVVKKIEGFKVASSGEYLYSSMGLKINAVLNVDIEKKQIRVITVLPPNRAIPKPGTKKILVEGIEYIMVEIE